MLGAHLSIAGGLHRALDAARLAGMDCLQVFTHNQRRWRVGPLCERERDRWLATLREMRWLPRGTRGRVVSHASYLINLASPEASQRRRSVALLRRELVRCAALRIGLCVVHPGSHLGAVRPPLPPGGAIGDDEMRGLERVARALDEVHATLPSCPVITCLETTAGSGTMLGWTFDHLARIREMVAEPRRVAFCLDTCHVTAAGYDMTTDRRAASVLRAFRRICGMQNLRVVHVNDSAAPVGSRRDRHEHIGRGRCGLSCFRAVMNTPGLTRVPRILETPKGRGPRRVDWDLVNIRRLRRLIAPVGEPIG